jgi:hypothetical protein
VSTINAILEPHADGTVHLPVPPELRNGKVEVTATLRAADGAPRATPEMLLRRRDALRKLRELGGLRDVIPDPVAWRGSGNKAKRRPA